jgi:hypothetical protein
MQCVFFARPFNILFSKILHSFVKKKNVHTCHQEALFCAPHWQKCFTDETLRTDKTFRRTRREFPLCLSKFLTNVRQLTTCNVRPAAAHSPHTIAIFSASSPHKPNIDSWTTRPIETRPMTTRPMDS